MSVTESVVGALDAARSIEGEIVDLRRAIHRDPELGTDNPRTQARIVEALGGLGLEVVPSQANFILVGFPTTPGRTAQEAEDFLAAQGLIVRGVSNYGLPNHLRITIGLEEHNRGIVDTLARFMGRE